MNQSRNLRVAYGGVCLLVLLGWIPWAIGDDAHRPLQLTARLLKPSSEDGKGYLVQLDTLQWNPHETAVIVCDMWDSHHCLNAVNRVGELAPRMNEVIKALRDRKHDHE